MGLLESVESVRAFIERNSCQWEESTAYAMKFESKSMHELMGWKWNNGKLIVQELTKTGRDET